MSLKSRYPLLRQMCGYLDQDYDHFYGDAESAIEAFLLDDLSEAQMKTDLPVEVDRFCAEFPTEEERADVLIYDFNLGYQSDSGTGRFDEFLRHVVGRASEMRFVLSNFGSGEPSKFRLDVSAVWRSLTANPVVMEGVVSRSAFWRQHADPGWSAKNGWGEIGSVSWLDRLERDVRGLVASRPVVELGENLYFGLDSECFPFLVDRVEGLLLEYTWDRKPINRFETYRFVQTELASSVIAVSAELVHQILEMYARAYPYSFYPI